MSDGRKKVEELIEELPEIEREAKKEIQEELARAEALVGKMEEIVGDGYGRLRERGTEVYTKAKAYLAEAREALERARERMKQVYGDASKAFQAAWDKLKARLDNAASELKKTWEMVKTRVAEIDVKEIRDDVVSYIQRNPGKSLLFALAFGFAVGYMVRRREA